MHSYAFSHLVISVLNFSYAILFGLPYFFPVPSFAAKSSTAIIYS